MPLPPFHSAALAAAGIRHVRNEDGEVTEEQQNTGETTEAAIHESADKPCMLQPNCTAQSNFSMMESSTADADPNIYREMSSDERIAVIRDISKECIYVDQLWPLLKKKAAPICYIWFQPSPRMDIAQGILKTIYVNKMVKAGYTVKILMADWFVQRDYKICNNKTNIRNIGSYNIEMWKAAGMDLDRVELVWLSDELEKHAADYWPLAMDVSRKYTVKRIASYCATLGPCGSQTLPAAEIFYPCMQVAATLCQKADIWLFGMDQRDIVMRTREYCEDTKMETKPTMLLHNILPNLVDSIYFLDDYYYLHDLRDPAWNIFMNDDENVLNRKIRKACCPPKVAVDNPCLEYIKYVIFPWFGKFEVVQKEQNGSNSAFSSIEELIADYESGDLDPADVKLAFQKGIYKILKHVWNCYNSNTEAQARCIAFEDEPSDDHRKILLQNEEILFPVLLPKYSKVTPAPLRKGTLKKKVTKHPSGRSPAGTRSGSFSQGANQT